jgi:hypothetical protein
MPSDALAMTKRIDKICHLQVKNRLSFSSLTVIFLNLVSKNSLQLFPETYCGVRTMPLFVAAHSWKKEDLKIVARKVIEAIAQPLEGANMCSSYL